MSPKSRTVPTKSTTTLAHKEDEPPEPVKISSKLQIIFLVESNSHVSPYVYHMNDQPYSDRFYVINDKKILNSIASPNSKRTRVESGRKLSQIKESELVRVIINELCKIQKIHEQTSEPNSITTMSSLIKRGKVKTPDSFFSQVYVLISTVYNANITKLLIESAVPVRAVLRLVEDDTVSQQKEFRDFYEKHLKAFSFQNKQKRTKTRISGNCRELTEELDKDIKTFWKSLSGLQVVYPELYRNTIFLDSSTPYIDLVGCNGNYWNTLDCYRKMLYEDIRNVQVQIRDIVQAHQCYISEMRVQKLRTQKIWNVESLTGYKMGILTSGSNVACVLEGMLKQVIDWNSKGQSSKAQSDDVKNTKLLHLATRFLSLTKELNSYYCVYEHPAETKCFHARDQASLSLLGNHIEQHSHKTSMHMLRTFAQGLLREYFSRTQDMSSNTLLEYAKIHVNAKLTDRTYKSFLNKRFFLSFYLSLPLLELQFKGDEDLDNIPLQYSSRYSKHEEFIQQLKLKENFTEIKKQINQITDSENLTNLKYIENLSPNVMLQFLFSHVITADRLTISPLSITGDMLIQCITESHATSEHKFVIPTVLGLRDFYHYLMAIDHTSLFRKLIPCLQPNTPSEQSIDRCQVDDTANMFILPDSIKHEQYNDLENEENESSCKERSSTTSLKSDQENKISAYKYGIPQLVENQSSCIVKCFDKNVKVKIEKNVWTHKHVEQVSVTCHIRSHHMGNITEGKNHSVYYHINMDVIRGSILSSDLHILLDTDMQIRFKKKYSQVNFVSETLGNENSFISTIGQSPSFVMDVHVNDIVYEQSSEFVHKFTLVSPKYFPILCCANGLTMQVSNDSAVPFCILQYFTLRNLFPTRMRKYLLNASVLICGQSEDEHVIMTATGDTYLGRKSNLFENDETVTWDIISPEGDLYKTQDGIRLLEESSKLKVTRWENFEENCLTLKREDGFSMQFCEDGTLQVMYVDGTLFTTSVIQTELTVKGYDGFILISMSVQISHKDFFTVSYNYQEENLVVFDTNGFELKIFTDGSYNFHLDAGSSIRVDSDDMTWDLTDLVCGEVIDTCNWKLASHSPDKTLLTVRNAQKEMYVDFKGNLNVLLTNFDIVSSLDMGSVVLESEVEAPNGPCLDSCILVLSPDLSGFEIIPNTSVQSLLALLKADRHKQPDLGIIMQELDSLHPYYSTFVSCALPGLRDSSLISQTKHDRLPSTYGSTWWHPFHWKADSRCPSMNSQGWNYRLFHHIHKTFDDIVDMFIEALENIHKATPDIDSSDCKGVEDSRDIMERICIGNIVLKSVSGDEVEYIRKFVNGMLEQAIVLVCVSRVHAHNRCMLDVLKKRSKKPTDKKTCSKRHVCPVPTKSKCFGHVKKK